MHTRAQFIFSFAVLLLISACSLPFYRGINLSLTVEGDERSVLVDSDSISDPRFVLSCPNGVNIEIEADSFEVPGTVLSGCVVKLVEFKNEGVLFSYLDGFESHRPPEEGRYQDTSGNILFVRVLKQLAVRVVEDSEISFGVSSISQGDDTFIPVPNTGGRVSIHSVEDPAFKVKGAKVFGFRGLGVTIICNSLQNGTTMENLDCEGSKSSSLQIGLGIYQGNKIDANYAEKLLIDTTIDQLPKEVVEFIAPNEVNNGGFRFYPNINFILREDLQFILVLKRNDEYGVVYTYYIVNIQSYQDEHPRTQRVFLTSKVYNGDLGGVKGAHDKCQQAANDADLGGNWKAIISDSQHAAQDSIPQFAPLYNMNGDKVSEVGHLFDPQATLTNWAYDEFGQEVLLNDSVLAWTGTTEDGNPTQSNCHNWTSSLSKWHEETFYAIEDLGTIGFVVDSETFVGGSRLVFEWGKSHCESSRRLYCISID